MTCAGGTTHIGGGFHPPLNLNKGVNRMIVYINTDELSDETIMKIGEECGIEGINSR